MRRASDYLDGCQIFVSNNPNANYSENRKLRPVVQLGSDVNITPSATAKSATGIPHTINW